MDTIWGKMNITVNPGVQDGAKIRLKGQVILSIIIGNKKGNNGRRRSYLLIENKNPDKPDS